MGKFRNRSKNFDRVKSLETIGRRTGPTERRRFWIERSMI